MEQNQNLQQNMTKDHKSQNVNWLKGGNIYLFYNLVWFSTKTALLWKLKPLCRVREGAQLSNKWTEDGNEHV